MLKYLPQLSLFGPLVWSLVNTLAAAFGFGALIAEATGLSAVVGAGIAVPALGGIAYSWVSSLMSNRAGLALYAVNVALAPFGYAELGMPYWIGLLVALAPLPMYRVLGWFESRV